MPGYKFYPGTSFLYKMFERHNLSHWKDINVLRGQIAEEFLAAHPCITCTVQLAIRVSFLINGLFSTNVLKKFNQQEIFRYFKYSNLKFCIYKSSHPNLVKSCLPTILLTIYLVLYFLVK